MADVFISYAREDRLAAQKVAETLKRHGWSVWWDSEIPPGKTWDEMIERELGSASCVVVLWSATSLAKSWVKAEAAEALAREVLVPALIEAVVPPLAFRQIQAAPLMDWRGDLDHPGFQQLICSICVLAGLPTRPEAKNEEGMARAKGAGGPMKKQRGSGVCAAMPALVADFTGGILADGPVMLAPPGPAPPPGPLTPPGPPAPPQWPQKPEMPPVVRTGGIGWRFAAAMALIAALAGYGIQNAVDRFATGPSQARAGSNLLLETSTKPACAERAGNLADGAITASEGYEAVTRVELP
jgi:hypothetical protein